MPQVSLSANRRRFLVSTAASGAYLLGCRPQPSAEPAAPVVRHDVPLRVLLCGNDRWAEVLKTAWSAIAEQPLQIQVFDSSAIDAATWQSQVVAAMTGSDVAIVPAGLLAAIDDADALTPPNSEWLGEGGIEVASIYPVLKEGLMKYGGQAVAVPLGAVQPVLVVRNDRTADEVALPRDWETFVELAKRLPDGQVAEPLAAGAAAKMFLWRANASRPPVWLFDRETFAPVIASEPYVEVLETMKRCVSHYGSDRLTAGEVWSRVASGKLQMAIAWPAVHSDVERIEEPVSCSFAAMPTSSASDSLPRPTLVDYESPVAVLSSHCRQSEAAKRFLIWLVDGEGTSMIRSAVTGLTPVRGDASANPSPPDPSATAEDPAAVTYAAQAGESLSALTLRPPLQLLEYRQYAAALDAAVLSCLDGQQSAKAALEQAAKAWAELTQKVGVKAQQQAWRRAQGMSG